MNTMTSKKEQLINFIYKNEGKIATVEFDFRLNFSYVLIDTLHIQDTTEKQIILSDAKDDPKYLTKSKLSLCGINRIEEDENQIEIFYDNTVKVLISIY